MKSFGHKNVTAVRVYNTANLDVLTFHVDNRDSQDIDGAEYALCHKEKQRKESYPTRTAFLPILLARELRLWLLGLLRRARMSACSRQRSPHFARLSLPRQSCHSLW